MSFPQGFTKTAYTHSELKELVPEHKKLVKVLKSGNLRERQQEASHQGKELKEYTQRLSASS